MRRVVVFDFDGTLTKADSLLAFISYACGRRALLFGLLRYAPLLLLMKLRLCANWKVKQRFFAHFFRGMEAGEFSRLGREFAAHNEALLRPRGIAAVNDALRSGADVVIVSASIDDWVQPFFPQVKVVGTRAEVIEGRLTGRFSTPNCYGVEKVRRLLELFPDRASYHLVAYGDSRGDREMLNFSDEAFYKPFRERGQLLSRATAGEVVRFGLVGGTATLLQYGVYALMLLWLGEYVSMTIGYAVSFIYNFILSTHFTFRVKANVRRGAGFVLSHIVNYILQMVTLKFFLWVGVDKYWAPLPMFCVCVPVNFLLVRFFLKR